MSTPINPFSSDFTSPGITPPNSPSDQTFSAPPTNSGSSFTSSEQQHSYPNASVTSNLQKELDRLQNNIFTKNLSHNPDAQKIRDSLKYGGYLSGLFSGGLATAISTGVTFVATKSIGLGLGVAAAATCAACGAIGGAGFGGWLAAKFAKELSENHPGMTGMALATGWTVLGAPLAVGVFALAGAAKGFGVGLTGSFWMAQAVGFGAFKLCLIVLEPLAQKLIADPRIEKAQAMYADLSEKTDLSSEDMENLSKFCKEPLGYSMDYWYNTIFSPPLHEDLKNFAHYEEWNIKEKSPDIEKPIPTRNWEKVVAVLHDIGDGLKGLMTNPFESKSKTWKIIKHSTQTALHRFSFQTFRRNVKEGEASTALNSLTALANKSGFVNANQAWENYHQIERRYGRGSKELKILAEGAKKAITSNYGPEPSFLETLTCGLCKEGRLTAILALLQTEQPAN